MKASIILAHPYSGSFNHVIFETVIKTFQELDCITYIHDLYKEQFDPILTERELGTDTSDDPQVIKYTEELIASDYLVFIHPNWWGQPPAILKGYIDRVFRPPHAYGFPENDSGGGLPVAKLNGKFGIVFNTSNTDTERENAYFGDPLENIWKKCIFGFCGVTKYHRKMFRIVADSTEHQRSMWLEEVRDDIRRIVKDNSAG
jgi:putative NADPH-quinone reductase